MPSNVSFSDVEPALAHVAELVRDRFGATKIEDDTVWFGYREGAISLGGYVQVSPSMRAVLLRISTNVPISEEHRATAVEYITRINYELPVAGWTLSLDSGDIRWKSGFYFGDSGPSTESLAELIDSSVALVRMYLPGLIKVTVGRSVEAAFRANEENDLC